MYVTYIMDEKTRRYELVKKLASEEFRRTNIQTMDTVSHPDPRDMARSAQRQFNQDVNLQMYTIGGKKISALDLQRQKALNPYLTLMSQATDAAVKANKYRNLYLLLNLVLPGIGFFSTKLFEIINRKNFPKAAPGIKTSQPGLYDLPHS
jgi:hypothetical protein